MVMPEEAPWSAQNGHHGDPPDHVPLPGAGAAAARAAIFGRDEGGAPPGEGRPLGDPARPLRDASSLSVQGRHAEDLLFRARSHADSLAAQAQAEAEELLSRAQAQAELLRVHAEAMRAEAEYMRAEAAAVRAAVRDEAEAASARAESAVAEARAAAEELRSAMQLEAGAARQDFEQTRAEAMSIRRLVRAELDAALADAERLRGDIRRLCADTNKLGAELGLLLARAGAVEEPVGSEADGGPIEDWAWTDPGGVPAASGVEPEPGPPLDKNLAELLRQMWDAASGEQATAVETPDEQPEGPVGPWGARRASQPLIGSGGWHAKGAAAPGPGEEPDDAAGQPPPVRRRRRFPRG
ncbi:MAG: hypothetical protein M3326_14765 [Actinomycetota bacterium]|nr:hypothetical protein [Actinomycetota bacterium]